jgi:pyruvate/2-oxoglutarate dehydrogenase complex dihydrolipoamide dehydrogenase (E3) component
VPSKALLYAASRAQAVRDAGAYGIAAGEPEIDFAAAMAHVHRAIAAIEPHDSQERFEGLGVTVVRGAARFRDGETVEAGGVAYRARRIVITTGSRPAIPPIPGLSGVPYFTNETLFENTVRPEHLVIIGGGPIGLEMAQAHRRLGSRVTVVEAATPLARDDPELAAVALAALAREGVDIRARTKVLSAGQAGDGIALETDGGRIEGTHLLVAAGRSPNIEDLNLEAAGIAYTPRGITVDDRLRTSNRRVFAIGDVAGGLQFTHVASHQAGLIIRQTLFRLPAKMKLGIMPWVTYTDPEVAQIGLTEMEARARHGDGVRVARWAFDENDRALAEGRTDGLVKVSIGKGGRILGAGVAGPLAGEIIQTWALAIQTGLRIKDVAGMVPPYPTRGEANHRTAIASFAGLARNPWVRRLIGAIARLG